MCYTYWVRVAILWHLPQYEYGSRVPIPGYEAKKPRTRVVGSRDPYEYWVRWHSLANIRNLYYSTGSWKLIWYPLTGILCQKEAVWVAAESVAYDQEPCTQPTTTTTTNTSAFNGTSQHIGDKNWIQQVLLWLSSSFPINYICYQHTAVGN